MRRGFVRQVSSARQLLKPLVVCVRCLRNIFCVTIYAGISNEGQQERDLRLCGARIKNKVTEDVKGLDFISRLRPVTYYLNNKAMTTITGNKETPDFPEK